MALRDIVTLPDSVLRRKAPKQTTFDNELNTLIDDMIETMREAPGVGLAAPQIGISTRIIVVEFGDEQDETVPPKLYVVINPEIIKTSSTTIVGIEACLSVPGLAGEVERHESIVVKGFNRNNQQLKIRAKGWLARIFQHAIDHLDGIVYSDRAERVWRPREDEIIQDSV